MKTNSVVLIKRQMNLIKFVYEFMSGIQDVVEDFYLRLVDSSDITPETGKQIISEWNKVFRKMRKEIGEKNIDAYNDFCQIYIEE